jgi:hypothetical protein
MCGVACFDLLTSLHRIGQADGSPEKAAPYGQASGSRCAGSVASALVLANAAANSSTRFSELRN